MPLSFGARIMRLLESDGVGYALGAQVDEPTTLAIARAPAAALREVAAALGDRGGEQAMQLRIAEQYLEQFGQLARKGNTFVLPANMTDLGSMIALATGMLKRDPAEPSDGPEPRA